MDPIGTRAISLDRVVLFNKYFISRLKVPLKLAISSVRMTSSGDDDDDAGHHQNINVGVIIICASPLMTPPLATYPLEM